MSRSETDPHGCRRAGGRPAADDRATEKILAAALAQRRKAGTTG